MAMSLYLMLRTLQRFYFIFFQDITEKDNYISWRTQTDLVACLSEPNEMERPVGKVSTGSGPWNYALSVIGSWFPVTSGIAL